MIKKSFKNMIKSLLKTFVANTNQYQQTLQREN